MAWLGYLLLTVHVVLLAWSAGGVLEMTMPKVFWKPFTNPHFPPWLLVIHWGSVLFASVSFIWGYLTRWQKTPQVMVLAYGLMALVCVIETFGFMTSKTKYLAMAAEYAAYIGILLLLFRSHYFETYFGR
jgi:hypothetical protein